MNAINELKSFMINVQKGYEISSNNLANTTSSGFKKHMVMERDRQLLNYVDTSHGTFTPTFNSTQAALKGEAYFVIQTSAGESYTRCGDFMLNERNELVTSDGNPVMGVNGMIRARGRDQVSIDGDGNVYDGDVKLDTLRLVQPREKYGVETAGNGLLTFQADPVPARGMVMPETLEESNVDIMTEMTSVMVQLREFDFAQRLIKMQDTLQGKIVNDIGSSVSR